MNAVHRQLDHYIEIPEQEAYEGYDFGRPDDSSVQRAVKLLIESHQEEFQELLNAEDYKHRESERIDAAEYMMEDR